MEPIHTQLFHYQRYHSDPRNVATHYVGVPIILFSIVLMLTRPQMSLGGISFMPSYFAGIIASGFYLRLHIGLGLIMAAVLVMNIVLALWVSQFCNPVIIGIVMFTIGWIIQFIGHYYEGMKPAFFDDVRGLLIGPLFIACKLLFKAGFFTEVNDKIDEIKSTQVCK